MAPGTDHGVTFEQAREFARTHGYPVLLEAICGPEAARAVRRVDREADLESAHRNASSEAAGAFGSPEMYVEKLIERPRHIEIQVLGDHHGNMVHLGERECSIQRRHQKVIEECPSPLMALHPEMRGAMGEAAVKAARAAGYYNAGTVEFLVDADRRFYFLEMNTRLQVEHPVTELVTGLDLVRLQIEIAAERAVAFHSGRMSACAVRPSSAVSSPKTPPTISCHFPERSRAWPSLPARACAWIAASTKAGPCPWTTIRCWQNSPCGRQHANMRPREPCARLSEYHVGGIRTNISFFRRILEDPEFLAGHLHTGFIEDFFARSKAPEPPAALGAVAALVAAPSLPRRKPAERKPALPHRARG